MGSMVHPALPAGKRGSYTGKNTGFAISESHDSSPMVVPEPGHPLNRKYG